MSIFEWRLATECGTSQSLVMTQIVFAIYYLLGIVLVPGAWVRGTRNFVESKTGASFSFEQEGSNMGAHKVYSKGHLKLFVYRETPKTAL